MIEKSNIIKINDLFRLGVVFLVSIYSTCLRSQDKELYIHDSRFTSAQAVEYLHPYLYFNKANNQTWESFAFNQLILKYDIDLNPVDSFDIKGITVLHSSSYVEVLGIKAFSPNKLCILLYEQLLDSTTYPPLIDTRTHFLEIDTSFNVKNIFSSHIDSSQIRLVDFTYNDSIYILSGFKNDSLRSYPILVLLDSNLRMLEKLSFNSNSGSLPLTFANISIADGNLFVTASDALFGVPTCMYVFSSNVELIDSTGITNPGKTITLPNDGFLIDRINDRPIFMSSALTAPRNINNSGFDWSMGVGIVDSNFDFSRIDTFTFSGNMPSLPTGFINPKPSLDALDYLNVDSILMCMVGQEFLWGIGATDRFANDTYFYNYNAPKEDMNWIKVYNNGYTNSSFIPVTALPNNKYLVILNEYNWDKYSYDNLSIHLMIINGNGDLINQKENPHSRIPLTAYPNPFEDLITIENLPDEHRSYHYVLVSTTGQEVSKGQIGPKGEISLNEKHTGPHILRVYSKDDLLQSILVIAK